MLTATSEGRHRGSQEQGIPLVRKKKRKKSPALSLNACSGHVEAQQSACVNLRPPHLLKTNVQTVEPLPLKIQSPAPSNLLSKSQRAAQLSSLLCFFFANRTVSNLAELPFRPQSVIDPLSTLLSLNRLVKNHKSNCCVRAEERE